MTIFATFDEPLCSASTRTWSLLDSYDNLPSAPFNRMRDVPLTV
jgi:hypothetical protein